MPGNTDAERLYSAIEETARLVGLTCSRDKVWPILSAYGDALTADGGIVFSTQVGVGQTRDLEFTVQVSGIDDLYAHTLSHGFIDETDHPVGTLFSDLQKRVLIDVYAIDGGIVGGFKKIYVLFPRDMQGVAQLAEVPSMPRAVAENAAFFARYGLDDAGVIGIDYQRRTMNVYFQLPTGGRLEPATILAMLREIGLPEPGEQMLGLASRSYRVYATLGWDSPKIQRISFAPSPRRDLDLSTLPVRPQPEVEKLLTEAPYTYDGGRICTSVVKWSHDGEFLDFGAYYQINPVQLKAVEAATRNEQA